MSVELLQLGLSHTENSLLKVNPGRESSLVPTETVTALIKAVRFPFAQETLIIPL